MDTYYNCGAMDAMDGWVVSQSAGRSAYLGSSLERTEGSSVLCCRQRPSKVVRISESDGLRTIFSEMEIAC